MHRKYEWKVLLKIFNCTENCSVGPTIFISTGTNSTTTSAWTTTMQSFYGRFLFDSILKLIPISVFKISARFYKSIFQFSAVWDSRVSVLEFQCPITSRWHFFFLLASLKFPHQFTDCVFFFYLYIFSLFIIIIIIIIYFENVNWCDALLHTNLLIFWKRH